MENNYRNLESRWNNSFWCVRLWCETDLPSIFPWPRQSLIRRCTARSEAARRRNWLKATGSVAPSQATANQRPEQGSTQNISGKELLSKFNEFWNVLIKCKSRFWSVWRLGTLVKSFTNKIIFAVSKIF